jgi:hypothetical protein
MSRFEYGNAAEILRSSQKDTLYAQQLSKMLLDAVNGTFGARATLLYRQRLYALSDYIYYGTTTLAGNFFPITKVFDVGCDDFGILVFLLPRSISLFHSFIFFRITNFGRRICKSCSYF